MLSRMSPKTDSFVCPVKNLIIYFSLKLTGLIQPGLMRTTDSFLSPEAQTLTGYLLTVYFPCHNHILIVLTEKEKKVRKYLA